MSLGIINNFTLAANQAVAASTTLVTMGANTTGNSFVVPIGAGKTVQLRAYIPFTVGATGGCRFQIVASQTPASFVAGITLQDTVAPLTTAAVQTSSAAFTNALANAGNHFIWIFCTVVNGATAGNLSLQFACNTAANGITALAGAQMQSILY